VHTAGAGDADFNSKSLKVTPYQIKKKGLKITQSSTFHMNGSRTLEQILT
jgi:hypothetical protein